MCAQATDECTRFRNMYFQFHIIQMLNGTSSLSCVTKGQWPLTSLYVSCAMYDLLNVNDDVDVENMSMAATKLIEVRIHYTCAAAVIDSIRLTTFHVYTKHLRYEIFMFGYRTSMNTKYQNILL